MEIQKIYQVAIARLSALAIFDSTVITSQWEYIILGIFYFSLREQHRQINNFSFLILFFNSYFFAWELGIYFMKSRFGFQSFNKMCKVKVCFIHLYNERRNSI